MVNLTDKIAISMNGNAGSVTSELSRKVKKEYESRAQVYVSHSLEEAQENVQKIIEDKIGMVFNVAGDGGFFHSYNMIERQLQNGHAGQPHPLYAGVKLGTGNGLSNHLGFKKSFDHVEYVIKHATKNGLGNIPTKQITQIEITSTSENQELKHYFPFAGMGWDAMVLDNYNILKKKLWNKTLGAPGYVVAALGTFCQVLAGRSTDIEISLPTGNLKKIIDDHAVESNTEPNHTLLQGENINVCGVSTVPEYGSRLRAFPFSELANENNMMQLRVITGNKALTGARLFAHMYSVWTGSYRSNIIHDFLTNEIEFKYIGNRDGTPFQIAGESFGKVLKAVCKLSEKKMQMLDGHAIPHIKP